jgi:hypothetical protein
VANFEVPKSGRKVVDQALEVKVRIAIAPDERLTTALVRVCGILPQIRSCLLLDALFPGDPEIKLMILPALDERNPVQEDGIVRHLQEMLRGFPELVHRTIITFDLDMVASTEGKQIYIRSQS